MLRSSFLIQGKCLLLTCYLIYPQSSKTHLHAPSELQMHFACSFLQPKGGIGIIPQPLDKALVDKEIMPAVKVNENRLSKMHSFLFMVFYLWI
tara:strand:- start:1252 stop:1530 length:279 start_codon:yes stop_codon:yes gene_type:complete